MMKLTKQKIGLLVSKFYEDTTRDVEESWMQRQFSDKQEFLAEIEAHDAVFASLKDDLFCNQLGDFPEIVKKFLESQGIRNGELDDLVFRKLCRQCYAASIKATQDSLKRLSDPYAKLDEYLDNEPQPQNRSVGADHDQSAVAGYALSRAIIDYVDESMKLGNWTVKTRDETLGNLELLEEILGSSSQVGCITKKDLVRVRDTLIRLPAHRKKDRRYRNLRVAEILQMADDIKPMATKTVNNYMTRYIGFFNWLHKRDEIAYNPASGLTMKLKMNPRDHRSAFEKGELEAMVKLLRLEQDRPERYWICLLGMYTGARLNELCQLDVADISQFDGVWCMSVNGDGDSRKTLKTKYAAREIPIHDNLVDLGFLDYVNHRQASGMRKLFDLAFEERERYKKSISRWFNKRFKPKFVGGDHNGRKDFHSFRHTLVDYLMSQNVEEPIVKQIVGHSNDSITFGRYGKGFPVSILKGAIDELDYYGIEVVGILKP